MPRINSFPPDEYSTIHVSTKYRIFSFFSVSNLFSCLPVVEPEVVASLEVDGDSGVWIVLQVHGQHLLGHVVVVLDNINV